jgi:hypothetical protein
MPRLYMLTVPGLNVASDWSPVHDRLLDEFPEITDVLATTMPATLLIVYEGGANVDAWLDGMSDGILSRRPSAAGALRLRTPSRDRDRDRGRDRERTWGVTRARNRAP